MNALNACIQTILNDIRVELLDEFDKNFQCGSFFGTAKWPKSARPGAKTPLIDSGNLRRSIRGTISRNSIAFSSSLPYASIHNTGGTLTVTTKMKRYFFNLVLNGVFLGATERNFATSGFLELYDFCIFEV